MLRELKASRMGHWLEKKEDFFILSQEVKDADTSSMALLRAKEN
jgi:hypothetical protein